MSYIENGNAGYGLGFNRRTWRTGRTIGKYLKRGYDLAKPYLKRSKAKRTVKIEERRVKREPLRAIQGVQIPAGGGGESKSFYTRVRKNRTKVGKLELSKSTVGRSAGFSLATTQGLQAASTLFELFDTTDVDLMYTTAGTAADPGQSSAKIFVNSGHGTAMITNAESTNVHISLYDIIAKRDGGTLNIDPGTVFAAGMVDAVGGAAANATLIGTSPYNNPRFTAAYAIKKETKIILGPGQTHVHNVHYAPNKMFNHEWTRTNGTASGPVADWSYHCMIIHHGTPVHDATTETTVTIGLSKLDIVVTEHLTYSVGSVNYPSNSITTTLVTNATGEQMMPDAPTDAPDTS